MFVKRTSLRVRYADTDQMGVVYYGNYPTYFEVGRVESLRELGMTYRRMEEDGVMLPVYRLEIKYLKPARYDELLTIQTEIREMPNTRIIFHHLIYNERGDLLTTGSVELVFVDTETRRPRRIHDELKGKLMPYFNS